MLVIAYLTLGIALAISGTAIFYSVSGLAAIFAAAVIPIVIMGTTLEVAKLVVAVWLHRHWHEAPRYLKAYLAFAVVVLMGITSLGVFGFLSKAHIEQAAASNTQTARIERVQSDIAAAERRVERAQTRIEDLRASERDGETSLGERIQDARAEIAAIRDRASERIAAQQRILDKADTRLEARLEPHRTALDQIDQQVAQLDRVIDGLIEMDYLSRAQERQAEQKAERDRLAAERAEIVKQIEQVRSEPDADATAAHNRIDAIRTEEREAVARERKRIEKLESRQHAGRTQSGDVQADIDKQRAEIREARDDLADLEARKFDIEADIRALEAEVGPLKYIAAFLHGGEADKATLEEAVRWVIIIIIIVFDPLAVLMLIASQWSLIRHKDLTAASPSAVAPASSPAPRPAAAKPSTPATTGAKTPRSAPDNTVPPPQPATPAAPTGGPDSPAQEHPASAETAAEVADPEARVKSDLLDRAREGRRKPSPKAKSPSERELGEALQRYTDAQKTTFDREFTQQLREINPTWAKPRAS